MMSIFWLAAALMLLVAATFIFKPWIRFERVQTRQGLTSNWYQTRLTELQKELDSGQFSKQEYKEALAELKLTAKSELLWHKSHEAGSGEHGNNRVYILAALGIFLLVTSIFYWQAGHYQKLGDWEQTLIKMPSLTQKVIQNSDQAVTQQELQDFALGLRSKLVEKEEAIGWMLLGRTLMALGDMEGAVSAFEKSYEMKPNNASNAVSLAQALQQMGDEFELGRSVRILTDVLNYQPDNEMALLLFSEGNLLLERYDVAKQGFLAAKAVLASDDMRLPAIEQRLDFIARQLGEVAENSNRLAILVEVAPELESRLREFRYLFVFAKIDAIPMPIAVKKLMVSEFPVQLILSDADMMLPDLTLSSQSSVNLYARLSVDDQAPFASGDWQGSVEQIETNSQDVIRMLINEEFK